MRVLLKLVLDCPPDAAWKAIRMPAVFRAVSAPLTTFESLEVGGFPELWPGGEHRVVMKAAGRWVVGEQVIDVSFPSNALPTRIMRDSGRGVTGPLALVTRWEHSMAIAAAPGGKTLYRDQLRFEAGPLTPLLWPFYWAFWQWRGLRMKQLAPKWTS